MSSEDSSVFSDVMVDVGSCKAIGHRCRLPAIAGPYSKMIFIFLLYL